MKARELVQKLAEKADIRINGDRPWDIQVHNDDLYARVLRQGTLGLGEAYMDGWWDCEEMDAMFCRALRARLEQTLSRTLPFWLTEAAHTMFNLQSRARAFMVAKAHYDTDPALFRTMLGPSMQYSCARWEDTSPKYVERPVWKMGGTMGLPSSSWRPSLATTTTPPSLRYISPTLSRNSSS